MTQLLAAVLDYHKAHERDEWIDVDTMAADLECTVVEYRIHIQDRRWGDIFGTVLCLHNVFTDVDEYVMHTEYEYDEGAEGGDPEYDAYNVVSKRVLTTTWEPL